MTDDSPTSDPAPAPAPDPDPDPAPAPDPAPTPAPASEPPPVVESEVQEATDGLQKLSTDNAQDPPSGSQRQKAVKFMEEDRFLDAYRELKTLKEEELTEEEKEVIKTGLACEEFVELVTNGVDDTWNAVGESTKNYRYQTTSYKFETQPVRVDMVIESPVEASLFVPFVAALSEIDLYSEWVPNWSTPKFRVTDTETLKKTGKFSKMFFTRAEAPLNTIEFFTNGTIVDDTETSSKFLVHLGEMEDDHPSGLVRPKEEGIARVTLGGGLIVRKCEPETEERARALFSKNKANKDRKDEDFYMITLSIVYRNRSRFLNPNFFIKKMSSFMLKVVIGAIWNRLLSTAEEIRDGKRPLYDKLMEERKEDYEWLKACQVNISK